MRTKQKTMTKSHLTEICRNILYCDNFTIEKQEWLMNNVFKFHPHWYLKRYKNPVEVYRDKGDYNTMCFYLKFIDGSSADISFTKSINNIPLESLKYILEPDFTKGGKTFEKDYNYGCNSSVKMKLEPYDNNETKYKFNLDISLDGIFESPKTINLKGKGVCELMTLRDMFKDLSNFIDANI